MSKTQSIHGLSLFEFKIPAYKSLDFGHIFLEVHKNMWFEFFYVNKYQGVAALAWLFYTIGINAIRSVLKRQRIEISEETMRIDFPKKITKT